MYYLYVMNMRIIKYPRGHLGEKIRLNLNFIFLNDIKISEIVKNYFVLALSLLPNLMGLWCVSL